MEPSGSTLSKLPKLLAKDVAVVKFEEVEATNKVKISPDGKTRLDLSQGHRQKPLDVIEVQSMPRRTALLMGRIAMSVAGLDTVAKCADHQTKFQAAVKSETKRSV